MSFVLYVCSMRIGCLILTGLLLAGCSSIEKGYVTLYLKDDRKMDCMLQTVRPASLIVRHPNSTSDSTYIVETFEIPDSIIRYVRVYGLFTATGESGSPNIGHKDDGADAWKIGSNNFDLKTYRTLEKLKNYYLDNADDREVIEEIALYPERKPGFVKYK
jgi:hypothetical protein